MEENRFGIKKYERKAGFNNYNNDNIDKYINSIHRYQHYNGNIYTNRLINYNNYGIMIEIYIWKITDSE